MAPFAALTYENYLYSTYNPPEKLLKGPRNGSQGAIFRPLPGTNGVPSFPSFWLAFRIELFPLVAPQAPRTSVTSCFVK